jgi:hypothetical protein
VRFREDATALIRQKTNGLRPTCVDAEDMPHELYGTVRFSPHGFAFLMNRVQRTARITICLLMLLAAGAVLAQRIVAADLSTQAAWIPAATLQTPDGARRAVAAAVAAGTNTIMAPLPLYADRPVNRFAELLQLAHERQLQVYASVDIDRAILADEIPASRSHVVYEHPEWLMVPRALAPELLKVDVRSPEYLGRLARWSRANGVDGVYLSPLADETAAYVAATAAQVLRLYQVDGVQLDAVRYPDREFDYGQQSIESFREEIRPSLLPAQRAQVDSDEQIDPYAYPNAFPGAWERFRQARLTRLVAAVRQAIASALPGVPVIAEVSGAAESDLENHFQDWRAWIERRLVDAVSVRAGSTTTIVSDVSRLLRVADAVPTSGSR